MRKIFYCGLEAYNERYSLQLTDWSKRTFDRMGVDYTIVSGATIDSTKKINTGQVLDAHGRCYFSMAQMQNLVQMLHNGEITGEDCIFFEDLFTPGIESLPYIFDQIPAENRPAVWVRCLAQSIDPDDFVHVTGMDRWMRHYESLVNEFVTGVLASNEEMVAHMRIAGWRAPIYNISGLAFDADEVRERVSSVNSWADRKRRVVFASRFDQEKLPDFYMDIIEETLNRDPSIEFVLCQGNKLRSNDQKFIERARKLEKEGKLSIRENLQKNEYYSILNNSRLKLLTSLQEWTGNTTSEADALGCNVLAPSYRSFPEILGHDDQRLYVTWSINDAVEKLVALVDEPVNQGYVSKWTSKTIERCVDIMSGNGEEWRRDSIDYRNNVLNRHQ